MGDVYKHWVEQLYFYLCSPPYGHSSFSLRKEYEVKLLNLRSSTPPSNPGNEAGVVVVKKIIMVTRIRRKL